MRKAPPSPAGPEFNDLGYSDITGSARRRSPHTRPASHVRTLAALQRALEAAGVEFLTGNGVRLSRQVDVKPSGSTPGATKKPATGKRVPAPKSKLLRKKGGEVI